MNRPTPAELDILTVLWARGPCTVREVAEAHPAHPGYTTVLKLMQIMVDKKLVKRDEEQRAHVYRAAAPRDQMQNRLLKDLAQRAFDGSMHRLLQHALAETPSSPEELAELRRLLRAKDSKP